MLASLGDYLNSTHQVTLSKRYWQILIGSWLFHYLHATYDRYIHLTEAFRLEPDLQTIVLDSRCFRVPRNTAEYANFVGEDPFNLQIFSQLLHGMGYRSKERVLENGCSEWGESNADLGWRSVAKNAARRALHRLLRISILSRNGLQVTLSHMDWSSDCLWKLAWRTRFLAVPYDLEVNRGGTPSEPAFDGGRCGLAGLQARDEFERLFVHSLPQSFPSLYLEGFRNARHAVLDSVGKVPAVLVSAVGWYYASEPFKFLAAEAAECGRRLITVQHGAYGISRFNVCERYEAAVGASFWVWGWSEPAECSTRNMPSPKLSQLLTRRLRSASRKTGAILFVATETPRYLHRFQSMPTGTQWTRYLAWELRFLEAVPEHLRPSILFRPYQRDHGRAIRERVSQRFSEIRWDENQPFHRSLESSSLVVIDHPGTAFLEALVANVPMVLFWDPQCWEVRDSAAPYLESLRKVGILWNSPEAAAAMVTKIHQDPCTWWGGEVVQEARQRFAARYALSRRDWMDRWGRALKEEVLLSQAIRSVPAVGGKGKDS
jgi:putative transferase (TIGR04331 family)